jgi:hypothetical protein
MGSVRAVRPTRRSPDSLPARLLYTTARRFLLVNLACRFPVWPGQDRVHLQLLADYAWVDYIQGHRLPRSGLAGVGANLSGALTRRITLAVGYGYGVDAPRNGGFGGHTVNMQAEYKYWGW